MMETEPVKNPSSQPGAYRLIKQKGEEVSMLPFENEERLREHLIAMWSFTDWHLVAVVRV